MKTVKQFRAAALIVIVAAVFCLLYLVAFEPPGFPVPGFVGGVLSNSLTIFAVAWAAWIVIANLRGPDEVQSAATRYGLAFGGGVGVPAAIAFVMAMSASPEVAGFVAEFVANLAAFSRKGLAPEAVGFALGVTFTMLTTAFFFVVGASVWWLMRR